MDGEHTVFLSAKGSSDVSQCGWGLLLWGSKGTPEKGKEKSILKNKNKTNLLKYSKAAQCPSINKWKKQLWYIYTMNYYWAVKKKEILLCAVARMT